MVLDASIFSPSDPVGTVPVKAPSKSWNPLTASKSAKAKSALNRFNIRPVGFVL